jgi:murein DD-endopeptidase MepM/ murein hydrolase activator NlpD
MMNTKKLFVALSMTIVLCVALARTGYSVEICKVISPSRFEKLHSFPVNVVVRFSQGARPDTFRASLNGIDITSRFKKIEDGVRAIIGPEDGLRIEVKTSPQQKINVLRTRVKGLKVSKQDVDFETFFFVAVDKLVTVGSEGGVVKSLDGHILVNIPQHALPSTTTIALTKMHGSGQIGPVYQLAPEGVNFNQPVTLTMKYDPTNLPPGVTGNDLFLILGNKFPRKLENLIVDKTAHTVSGTTVSFSKVFMSYYMKIGKRLTDIPPATGFRLPIGDNSDASYTCGQDYQSPSKNDLGETLTLLHRSSYANFDYPKIILNENGNEKGTANTWRVITAYNRNRYINSAAGPTRDGRSLYREDKGMFCNGEDWSLAGHRYDYNGFPIHAIADGLVIYNGRGYGKAIVLAHQLADGPVLSIYSHIAEKSPCAVGTLVHKGNVIGRIGHVGTEHAYLHYEIGKQPIMKVNSETGEIKVPATWFGEWSQGSVYENYYDPTNFLFNIMGKHKWDFNINGNDEGWVAKNVKEYESGYTHQVRDGMLSVKPRSRNLRIVSYPLKIEAESFDSVLIRMKSNAPDGHGKVYFGTDEEPKYSEDKSVGFEILSDSDLHGYRILMADNHKWKGTIVRIRIDILDTVVGETTEISFDNIRIGRAYLSQPPDTGQTKCYNGSQEITCPAPGDPFYGQDGHYAINPPSYEVRTINGQEVVIDHVTGLTWQRHDDGIKRTWTEAMDYCENLTLDGYSDWRLPQKKELQSIANYGSFGPAVDVAYFPYPHVPADCYWSASTLAFLALSAWKVCLWNSQVDMSIKSDHNYVRAVRGRPLEFCHFIDNGDGTVTDMTTGLMWQQTEAKAMTWEKALAYCKDLDLAGYRDWQLPNIRELLSLVDDSSHEPSIDTAYFPGCRPSIYWSSTTHSAYPSFAWYVGFKDGQVRGGGHKGRRNYVRAVRGGR